MLRSRALRWTVMLWACVLVFGLAFNVEEATALHGDCGQQCSDDCGEGNCGSWETDGCTCVWMCSGGGGGNSICAAP